MFAWFTTIFYQPLFNAVVLFYWLVGHTPIGYDMGFAVILLTILIRILLLPFSLASYRTASERRKISEDVKRITEQYGSDPIALRRETKLALRAQPRILISEGVMFIIQIAISLVLWRIFATGLLGEDLHLLYAWMPNVPLPYHLTFLDRFDLTHPDLLLNLIQSTLIFILETIAVLTSPSPVTREESVRVQLVLPIVSFMVFAFLPAGKKLFVITTLSFSLLILLIQLAIRLYQRFLPEPEPEKVEAVPMTFTMSPDGVLTAVPTEKSSEPSLH